LISSLAQILFTAVQNMVTMFLSNYLFKLH
jgi:hypothetical protein